MDPAVFDAIADGSRRRILELLATSQRTVGELVLELAMEQSSVSKHLRVLREAGLATSTPDGRLRHYRLVPQPLRDTADWIGHIIDDE